MPKIRILIADDHALVRSGFRALLSAQPDLEVAGEAIDGVAVVQACERLQPDVVLMDLNMPGRSGIAAIHDLRQSCPDAKVLVVTMHEDEAYAQQALLAGAHGYVLKKSLATELLDAIHQVCRGEQHFSPDLRRRLDVPPAAATNGKPRDLVGLLTAREREVLTLIALGHTTSETACRLHISEKTVETHRMHIGAKLCLRRRAELVRFALEYKLIGN